VAVGRHLRGKVGAGRHNRRITVFVRAGMGMDPLPSPTQPEKRNLPLLSASKSMPTNLHGTAAVPRTPNSFRNLSLALVPPSLLPPRPRHSLAVAIRHLKTHEVETDPKPRIPRPRSISPSGRPHIPQRRRASNPGWTDRPGMARGTTSERPRIWVGMLWFPVRNRPKQNRTCANTYWIKQMKNRPPGDELK
jgi:hypothetical protein